MLEGFDTWDCIDRLSAGNAAAVGEIVSLERSCCDEDVETVAPVSTRVSELMDALEPWFAAMDVRLEDDSDFSVELWS